METKQKTVTVEIPEGKKAVWNEQGILQLVDEEKANEPKDITERIKTFYDAYSKLKQMANHNFLPAQKLIKDYNSAWRMEMSDDIVAYTQLRIIAAALNEGWKPQIDVCVWCPNLFLYTKKEIDEMSDYEKDKENLLLLVSSGDDGVPCGLVCSTNSFLWLATGVPCGYSLVYRSAALAEYAGRQFAGVYARFLTGGMASDAVPWREYEQKHKSSGNK